MHPGVRELEAPILNLLREQLGWVSKPTRLDLSKLSKCIIDFIIVLAKLACLGLRLARPGGNWLS
jgi:hypothetical protein